MAKRIQIGNVLEIATSRGPAYSQYSSQNKRRGSLLRVLPGFHVARSESLTKFTELAERFVIFFPLQEAVNQGLSAIAGDAPVPVSARPMPLFRKAGFVDRTGRVLDWWLWYGSKQWRVGDLSLEQCRLPILSLWNDNSPDRKD